MENSIPSAEVQCLVLGFWDGERGIVNRKLSRLQLRGTRTTWANWQTATQARFSIFRWPFSFHLPLDTPPPNWRTRSHKINNPAGWSAAATTLACPSLEQILSPELPTELSTPPPWFSCNAICTQMLLFHLRGCGSFRWVVRWDKWRQHH